MEEILPLIRNFWINFCKEKNIEYDIVNVDTLNLKTQLPTIISSDLIIVTSFNTKISFAINLIREKLKIDSRILFYLHGLATIGLWPLVRFQMMQNLNTNDIFIGTCEGDFKSIKETLVEFNYLQSYFPYSNQIKKISLSNTDKRLVYIGRISPQKNLHHLIKIYSKLSYQEKKSHPLIFFGKEDHLGYPNLGISNNHYLEQLKFLIKELNLEEFIEFKGHIPRNDIDHQLSAQDIIISLSTHSDENYGMVIYRYLQMGFKVILTKWGGHKNYLGLEHNQVSYCNVFLDEDKFPIPDYKSALESIRENFNNSNKIYNFKDLYIINQHFDQLYQLLTQPLAPASPLLLTNLAKDILKNQSHYEMNGQIQRCFNDSNDLNYLKMIQCYF